MDKPPLDTLVPQRRGVGRWPVTLTTERANPLRQRNPDWGGCSTARRPVAAVNKLSLRRSAFVKLHARDDTAGRADSETRTTRTDAAHRTSIASPAGCASRTRELTANSATGDWPSTLGFKILRRTRPPLPASSFGLSQPARPSIQRVRR